MADMSTDASQSMSAGEIAQLCECRPTVQTVYRWSRIGIRIGSETVKLSRRKEGGRYVYFASDLKEFLAKLNGE
jgi:hypothetical protein